MLTGFNPQTIQDLAGARQAIIELLNLVEELKSENQALREEVQRLRDENNWLKGEQGKPDIKPNRSKPGKGNHSSEKERRQSKPWRKGRKLDRIRIDREEKLRVDKSQVPADAEFKGYEETVVQDLRISTDNVRFLKEKYYSPSQRQVYLASMPAGYEGQFGPGVRALVLTLYYAANMTEPKIGEFLTHLGVVISAGQISNLLVKEKDSWHEEKEAVWRAGLVSTTWQHIDDTATRVDGVNQHCHILGNPFYTAYFTRPGKDRLTVIHLLQGSPEVQLLLNAETAAWLDLFKTPQWAQGRIAQWPQGVLLPRFQLETLIQEQLGSLNDQQQARILESAALTAYHAQSDVPMVATLVSDDAPQFQQVTQQQALCWIHEGRHYKKLSPFVDYHRQLLDDFLQDFWQFYHQLQAYREHPTPDDAAPLRAEFDALFSTVTGYQELDQRIANTKAKQERLLQVLDNPELPLHNNPAELGARQRVRKRDISFGPRTPDGVAAWDTFMTLAETAKKLGVNFYAYIHDRVSGAYCMPSLAHLIRQRCVPAHEGAALV
jgi:hypothetical protein